MSKKYRLSKPWLIVITIPIFIGLHVFVALAILLTLLYYALGKLFKLFFSTNLMISNREFENKSADIAPLWYSDALSSEYMAVGNTQRLIELRVSTKQLTKMPAVEAACSKESLRIIWINKID